MDEHFRHDLSGGTALAGWIDAETSAALSKPTATALAAAKILGVNRNTLYLAVSRDEIPHIKVGGKILIPCAWLRKSLGLSTEVAA